MANGDPLLTGVDQVFPNVNSSSAPTSWEEDLVRAAQEGLPSGPGPMLTITKRSTDATFLPGGQVNPAAESYPSCIELRNVRVRQGVETQLSEARIGLYNVGAGFTGGSPGIEGSGAVGLSDNGNGLFGAALGDTQGLGVGGWSNSPLVTDAGVYGRADKGAVGVCGESFLGSGIGVRGSGATVGVRGVGLAVLPGSVGGIGVEGIPGPFNGEIIPWAGAFRGNVRIDGDCSIGGSLFVPGGRSALVRHPDGTDRALHAVESPEGWLEDFGRAELVDGRAEVSLDPDFAAVARPGDDYHVFLTPEGDTDGLYVDGRTAAGFEVREARGGRNTLRFSYRVVTRRPDVDGRRLPPVDHPAAPTNPVAEPVVRQVADGPPAGWPTALLGWPPGEGRLSGQGQGQGQRPSDGGTGR